MLPSVIVFCCITTLYSTKIPEIAIASQRIESNEGICSVLKMEAIQGVSTCYYKSEFIKIEFNVILHFRCDGSNSEEIAYQFYSDLAYLEQLAYLKYHDLDDFFRKEKPNKQNYDAIH
uniref:DUF727 domain-containing protein n=1 Tax=Heterorhabditis bacteriophora TaxID=37862 RepID=A0A1I7XIR3_HETBA